MIARVRVVLCVLVIALLIAGQPPQDKKDSKDKKDPQSAIEPRSGPGAGHKFLEKFVGTWDVEKSFHPRSGEPVRQKGQCRQTMIHDGRFLKSEFVFESDRGKTTGTGLIGFEAATGLFTSVWTDSRSTRMSFRQSREKFNGEEITLEGVGLGDTKETRKSRTVTRLEENGGKIVHRQYGAGSDGKERLVMELVMTRKADAHPPP